jgi:RNA polymerase sigma-70 factor, ECF subfamily
MIAKGGSRHYDCVGQSSIALEEPAVRDTGESVRERRLDRVVAGHFDFVWRLLRRLGLSRDDADDAAQHVFMIATEKLDRISDGKERTFLYGAALRVAANARRAGTRRQDVPAEVAHSAPSPAPEPDELTELGRARTLLDALIGKLPEELRRVIVLAEIAQMEVAEIAELEQIPVGTAASRLRRARALFKQLLRDAADRNPFGAES